MMILAGYNPNAHIILLIEDNLYSCKSKTDRKKQVKSIINNCQMKNKLQIQCLNLSTVLDDEDKYTYSSNFYNDFANIMIAQQLIPLIQTWM